MFTTTLVTWKFGGRRDEAARKAAKKAGGPLRCGRANPMKVWGG
jgi:hypothetical protein